MKYPVNVGASPDAIEQTSRLRLQRVLEKTVYPRKEQNETVLRFPDKIKKAEEWP